MTSSTPAAPPPAGRDLPGRRVVLVEEWLAIGGVSERTGVATSALRFYEAEGLIHADRTASGQRRYPRDVLRRIAFVRSAQQVGLSLDEIREAMRELPDNRTPTKADWARLSRSWTARLDARIHELEQLRDKLTDCIGCGCLSLRACHLYNPDDAVAVRGPGPRLLMED